MKNKLTKSLAYVSVEIGSSKLPFITLLIWVTIIKVAISAGVVFFIEFMELGRLWAYPDFDVYSSGKTTGPNFLYSIFINLLQAKSLSNPVLIMLACVSSGLIDTVCIYLFASMYPVNRKIIIMYLIFCLHPYFSFYTFRFDTVFFGKISCILFICSLHFKEKINSEFSNFLMLFLSMFRLSSLIFLFASLISDKRLNKLDKKFLSFFTIWLIFSYIIYSLNTGYSKMIMATPETYGWQIDYTKNLFGSYGFIIDNLVLYVLKTIVLFGGREAIYINQFSYFDNSYYPNLEYFALFCIALFNFLSLISFILIAKTNKFLFPVLFSLSLLVFCIITVSHMRYLVIFYPMLLIGWMKLAPKD